mgnify:CR=1 FL=1
MLVTRVQNILGVAGQVIFDGAAVDNHFDVRSFCFKLTGSGCLAALGAEVIKVERPGSGDAGRQHAFTLDDQQSGYFLQLNMGKQGVSVNMKDPRGKAFMQRLTDSADVFIENYRPGALDKLGLAGMGRDAILDYLRTAKK